MLSKDILAYSKVRYELRAYMTYLFEQNIHETPQINLEQILKGVEKIKDEIKDFELIYVLDSKGNQLSYIASKTNLSCVHSKLNENYADRAYFYEAIEEERCIVTNPYPTMHSGKLIVTASYPIYDHKHKLQYVICIDVRLSDALKITATTPLFNTFSHLSTIMYFMISTMLGLIALLLMIKGFMSFWDSVEHFRDFKTENIFRSTILLTLALAILDLVKTIFEEEVLGRNIHENSGLVNRTMIRFLGSVIIALAIEALMLVFKFTLQLPEEIIYAVYLLLGVSALLIGLAVYVKLTATPKRRQN
ncbi:PDC sensor domain-containing protein [Helicobacter himalayensis]|uniref:PDC sensor domain-containing protein n=1 Tax=Helicobacter himalayensis TaxID=1591088 RepID=UPI00082E44A9|nr:PDC sensor domain-containing protein [Helicobacter himalayensis]